MVTIPRIHPRQPDTEEGREPEFAPLVFDPVEEIDDDARAYAAPRSRWSARYRGMLLLTLICGALIAAAWLAWEPAFEAAARGASTLAEQDDGRAQWSASVGLGAIALLGWALAWGRSTHPRRAVRLAGGRGRITVDAVAGGLRGVLLEIPEVREAEVRVENRGRGRVLVHAWLRVTPQARIDDTLDEVDDATAWLVQEQLRLLLAEPPLVDVRYDELDLRPRQRAGAGTEEDA